jgi:hypothetical protein
VELEGQLGTLREGVQNVEAKAQTDAHAQIRDSEDRCEELEEEIKSLREQLAAELWSEPLQVIKKSELAPRRAGVPPIRMPSRVGAVAPISSPRVGTVAPISSPLPSMASTKSAQSQQSLSSVSSPPTPRRTEVVRLTSNPPTPRSGLRAGPVAGTEEGRGWRMASLQSNGSNPPTPRSVVRVVPAAGHDIVRMASIQLGVGGLDGSRPPTPRSIVRAGTVPVPETEAVRGASIQFGVNGSSPPTPRSVVRAVREARTEVVHVASPLNSPLPSPRPVDVVRSLPESGLRSGTQTPVMAPRASPAASRTQPTRTPPMLPRQPQVRAQSPLQIRQISSNAGRVAAPPLVGGRPFVQRATLGSSPSREHPQPATAAYRR